ncbi:MAG: UbiD family decarboxylase [Candidatus Micrarchaeota archaeon]|nr:UbiD family decarboxylase [Candidatus Micrarchaeota archaeon]
MSFRGFLEKLEKQGRLTKAKAPVSKRLEMSGALKELDGKPVMFNSVKESGFRVAGNVFSTKDLVAEYLGTTPAGLIQVLAKAIVNPTKPRTVSAAPCQEVVETGVDLDKLPILFHCEKDGGPYVSSGIVVAKDKELGQNASYHRLMQFSKNKFAIRILPRHLDEFLKRSGGETDVAVVVGSGANVGLACACSVELGTDELAIANSLEPLDVVKAKTVDLMVPADAEFVLEGRITKEKHSEGPFVDLTETYDIVREQQVLEINAITHRKDAIWQALLPGALEHKLLMGMPREPTIFREVSKVAECRDAYVNPGGCSWLHAIVQIKKKGEDDGKKAIEAAFAGHHSLKHVFVVDDDINIYDPLEVEWAMATRFQADKQMIIKPHDKGSSLDPSADPQTRETCKAGFDLTKPLVAKGKNYEKAAFPKVDLKKITG